MISQSFLGTSQKVNNKKKKNEFSIGYLWFSIGYLWLSIGFLWFVNGFSMAFYWFLVVFYGFPGTQSNRAHFIKSQTVSTKHPSKKKELQKKTTAGEKTQLPGKKKRKTFFDESSPSLAQLLFEPFCLLATVLREDVLVEFAGTYGGLLALKGWK